MSSSGNQVTIKKGIAVNILRNDGRIHLSVVSAVNYLSSSVTVEWVECNDIKGKELSFEDIYRLNEHLRPRRKEAITKERDDKNKYFLPQSRGQIVPPRLSLSNGGIPDSRGGGISSRPARYSMVPLKKRPLSTTSLSGTSNALRNASSMRYSMSEDFEKLVREKTEKRKSISVMEHLVSNNKNRGVNTNTRKIKESPRTPNAKSRHWEFSEMIRKFRDSLNYEKLLAFNGPESNKIIVCIRKRPLNKSETLKREIDVVSVPRKDTIVIHEPKYKVDLTKYLENHEYRFDYVFDEKSNNEFVYNVLARPLMNTIFSGGMATCFAYGQTGSGKTYTMGGTISGKMQDSKRGIYAMVATDIFEYIYSPKNTQGSLLVVASFFEIYGSKAYDLLADKAKLRVLEDGSETVQIVGLNHILVQTPNEVMTLIEKGNSIRTSGRTASNVNSSRSHAIFQLTLLRPKNEGMYGKISLIDLAGNERGATASSSDRVTQREGADINRSLLALKECIRALGRRGAYLPFRGSMLTLVLRDSFIGENSRTCMIATISPAISYCDHSLNTLRYAARVKDIASNLDHSQASFNIASDYSSKADKSDLDSSLKKSFLQDINSKQILRAGDNDYQINKLGKEMFDSFRNWMNSRSKWDIEENNLINMASCEGVNRDAFSLGLQGIVNDQQELLNQLEKKVIAFKQKKIL